jgi:hypothetical protein
MDDLAVAQASAAWICRAVQRTPALVEAIRAGVLWFYSALAAKHHDAPIANSYLPRQPTATTRHVKAYNEQAGWKRRALPAFYQ